MVDINKLLDFFFEAGLATYAGDGATTSIAELPGSKVLRFGHGPFLYVDTYFVNGTVSCGQTLIWHDDIPVWTMQYRGYCLDKGAVGVLKQVLLQAYRMRRFNGGRGESHEAAGGLGEYRYHNWPTRNGFALFEGKEFIDRLDRKRLPNAPNPEFWAERVFMHEYAGGLLCAS